MTNSMWLRFFMTKPKFSPSYKSVPAASDGSLLLIIVFNMFRAPDYSIGTSTSSYQQQTAFSDKKGVSTPNSIQQFQMSLQKPKTKVENNNKSFTCTECGKGLARKDKLVSDSF